MKRKAMAQRERNGKPKRSRDSDLLLSPVEVQRMRTAAAYGLRDAVWGSMLGHLLLTGKITNTQFAAGERWGKVAAAFEHVTQSPQQPRSPQIERTAQGVSFEQVVHELTAKLMFNEAHAALLQAGTHEWRAVIACCEHNRVPIGFAELKTLREGLDALSSHWQRSLKKRGGST